MAQLSIKKALAKMLNWMKAPLVASGTVNTNVFYTAKRTDTNVEVSLGVGSGGVNHGVWSTTLNKWLIYGDASTVYVNGVQMRKTAVTVTKSGSAWTAGSINAWYNSGSVTVQFSGISIGTISARTVIATIPAGFRPPSTEIYTKAQNSAYIGSSIIINGNGNISVESGLSGKTGIYASVTYVAWN